MLGPVHVEPRQGPREYVGCALTRVGVLLLVLIISTGCRVDPLRSQSHIHDRGAWLVMKRLEMRAEAHRLGLGSICILPIRGETSLIGSWSSPDAQLQTDQQERRSLRDNMLALYRTWHFQVADRSEDEMRQIEYAARSSGSRLVSEEGYIGRSVGADIVMTLTLDIIREAYFVPYVGWKTRGWTIWTERYWNSRDDRLLTSFVWDGRRRKALVKGIKRGHLFRGLLIDVATTQATPDEISRMSEHFAAIRPTDVSWHFNYFLGNWFTNEERLATLAGSRQLAIAHYRRLAEKVPGAGFLRSLALSKIAELEGDRLRAGDLAVAAAKVLPRQSVFLEPQLQRATNLLGVSRSNVNARVGLARPPAPTMRTPSSSLQEVDRAVVYVACELPGALVSTGSGFMIRTDGMLLTNQHVIDKAQRITVKYWDGVWGVAEVVAMNAEVDLALLRVARRDIPIVQFARQDRAPKGSSIYVIGNPAGLEHTFTRGIVSGYPIIGDQPRIQTDAAINSGNSGGPMVDERGYLLGIATSRREKQEGIGFGIPLETVRAFVQRYLN